MWMQDSCVQCQGLPPWKVVEYMYALVCNLTESNPLGVFFNGKTTDKMLTGHQEEGRQKQQVQNPKLMMDSVGPLELCKFYDTQV